MRDLLIKYFILEIFLYFLSKRFDKNNEKDYPLNFFSLIPSLDSRSRHFCLQFPQQYVPVRTLQAVGLLFIFINFEIETEGKLLNVKFTSLCSEEFVALHNAYCINKILTT